MIQYSCLDMTSEPNKNPFMNGKAIPRSRKQKKKKFVDSSVHFNKILNNIGFMFIFIIIQNIMHKITTVSFVKHY